MVEQVKRFGKRFLAGLLCIMIFVSGVQFPTRAAEVETEEGTAGSFYLTASTDEEMLIEPVEIFYSAQQTTLRQVLEQLENYNFIFNGDFIGSIENVDTGWSAFTDSGSYSLDMAPSEIQVLVFTTGSLGEDDTETAESATLLSELVKVMAQYNAMTAEVKNYPKTKEAYAYGQEVLRGAIKEEAAVAAQNLTQAIADYDEYINGERYTVTVEAFRGETLLENPVITFTDICGVTTVNENSSAVEVVAGEYTYVITDGGYNRVEGSINVTEATSLQVKLPEGNWFSDIQIKKKVNNGKIAFASEIDAETHTAEFYIDDTIGPDDLYLYVEQGSVPESAKTAFRTCYIGTDGEEKSQKKHSWNSNSNILPKCLNNGMEGKEIKLEAYCATENYTQVQSYDLSIKRVPTLQNLVVREGSDTGTSILSGFVSDETEYQITTVADKLYIEGTAYGVGGYTITGDGLIELGEANYLEHTVTVTYADDMEEMNSDVGNDNAGVSRKYKLIITKVPAVAVTFTMPQDTTEATSLEVRNVNNDVVTPMEGQTYCLIPEQTYTYVATKKDHYHTTAEFTATENLVIAVAEPDTTDALQNFVLYDSAYASSREDYSATEAFTPGLHNYTYTVSDENSMAAVQATVAEGYTATVCYQKQSVTASQHGNYTEVAITQGVDTTKKAEVLKHFLASCGYEQQMTVRLSKEAEGVTWYQDYEISLLRSLHLSDLSLESEGNQLFLVNTEGQVVRFDSEKQDCYVGVAQEAQSITIKGAFVNEKTITDICGGYRVEIQGQTYESLAGIEIPLTEDKNQTIEVTVKHVNENSVPYTYRIHVEKQEAVAVQFVTTPEEARIFMIHQQTNSRVYANAEGNYLLFPNHKYTYTVTCNGYIAKQVKDYIAPVQAGTIEISLEKATENKAIDKTIIAQWSSFRNTSDNNCVTHVKAPIEPEKANLYWATKLGVGYGSKATGCPIIVDGYLYAYGGKTIYKIDTVNGEIIATGEMVESSSFAVNPPTYAQGMIFIGLKDGRIQAFNAKTLESLWIFQDEMGGQPNCPITYHNGYIYTGFWNGENQEANYVCVSVTDEDITQTTEKKLPSWTYSRKGGFYWAGAYVCDDYMLIGTDDGEAGYAVGYGHIISLNPESGELMEDVRLPFVGDVRSNMVLYEGKFYFTSKGGYFYEISVNADGSIAEDSLRYIKLENGSTSASNPAMSTSTPTIYNGRAYVGVSGISQFGAYSGHNIAVLDLKKWKIAYSVPTQGYPQTSGLLTTAYGKEDQTAYIYFFDNYTPGKLRIIQDKPGQSKVTLYTEETYKQAGEEKVCKAGKVLFTPSGNHAQYALCSPIVDEYGTIYFKNDSAYLMAVGSTIEKIQVVSKPDKTRYLEGETFDATGMKVVATYSNGKTRDVTDYVTFSKEPLTLEDDDLTIQFNHVLYQDKNGETGVDCEKPMTSVRITVQKLVKVPAQAATLDKDGNIAHWKDTKTGKLYADAKGNTELKEKDIVIHKIVNVKLSADSYTYNGKEQKPTVTVKDSQGTLLKEGTDYKVSYGEGCKNAGTYTVKVVFQGKYSGNKTLQYEIKAAEATAKLSIEKYTYNGKVRTPKIVVKGINGTTLKKGTDYMVSYDKGRKKVGRYKVKVTYKGNYAGSKTLYFYINPAGTKLSKVKAGKKKATVTWKKNTRQVTGYEVQYAKNKKFKKATTVKITFAKTVKKTIQKLSAKKKYYFRIRTYKTVKIGGKKQNLYSVWSSAKAVTIK